MARILPPSSWDLGGWQIRDGKFVMATRDGKIVAPGAAEV